MSSVLVKSYANYENRKRVRNNTTDACRAVAENLKCHSTAIGQYNFRCANCNHFEVVCLIL